MEEEQHDEHHKHSRVLKVDSVDSWDLSLSQSNNHTSPVVVHFTASWCIPSVVMKPYFQELASIYQDALFLTVDVDELKEVANRLEVKAMPTFVLLKDGKVMERIVGANPEEIKKRVDGFVQSSRVHII